MRANGRLATVVFLAYAAWATAAGAEPGPNASQLQEADAHFKQGVQLFKANDYQAALVEFRKAHSTVPDWRVLFNIGRTCSELGDAACAVTAYRRYVAEAAPIEEQRKTDVQAEIARLERRVGVVQVTSSEPNAELSLDDALIVEPGGGARVVVNVGRHRLSARFADGTVDSRVVDVAGGEQVQVSLEPPKAAAPIALAAALRPAPPPPVSAPSARSNAPIPVWTGWVATSAFALGGTATGLWALSSRSDAEAEAGSSSSAALAAANDKTHHLALASDMLLGAALVSGAVSLYFTLQAPQRSEPEPRVSVGVAPGALRLRGTF